MKIKALTIALLAGSLSMGAYAGFDQFAPVTGEANVFRSNGGIIGDYWFFSGWGVPALQSITSDERTFELLPNVNAYADNPDNSEWRNNGGAGPDGNAWMEMTTLFRANPIPANSINADFAFTVDANDLSNRYSVVAFLRVRETSGDWLVVREDTVTVTTPGTYALSIDVLPADVGRTCDAGFTMSGLNANPADDWGSVTITATDLAIDTGDTTPPSPDPMTFETDPYAVSDDRISMTATTATDEAGVEYLFTNTVNNTSSGWQSSPVWLDEGPASGVATVELPIVNDDFDTDGDGWGIAIGGGGNPAAAWMDDAGNGVMSTSIDGTLGVGGWALATQEIILSTTDFSAGDTITLSADIKAMAALNGGGALLKVESWADDSNLDELEVPMSATESWDNYSMDYTIATGATMIKIVFGTSTGWAGANAINSSYVFDNVVVSKEEVVNSGLDPDTLYTYQVKARDDSLLMNETAWSAAVSASTNVEDMDAPTPNPMTFAGTDVSPITVMLTATVATDASEVEYYFANTAGGGNDSGWQMSPVYYDTGLMPGSDYSYTVIARDLSAAANSTLASAPVNVTTMDAASYEYNFALTDFSGNTDSQAALFEVEKAGLTTGSVNADAIIAFDTDGATFGDGLGYQGRDLLKTIASGYQNVSFEAYATLTFAGQTDLSGYIGMGQGLQTSEGSNFGVPELNLEGVNGVVAQFKDITAGDVENINSTLFKFVSGNPGANGGTNLASATIGSTETIRARLIYDAVAETVNVAYHKNYTGGAFVADINMGTVSTSLTDTNAVDYSMWDGAPVSIYAGGGEGTIVKDFEIVVTAVPLTTFDLQIADDAGSGVVLSWVGGIGQTYEAQYTTSLTAPTWNTDTTVGVGGEIEDVGGSMSVTSTVGVAEAFYRFILQE